MQDFKTEQTYTPSTDLVTICAARKCNGEAPTEEQVMEMYGALESHRKYRDFEKEVDERQYWDNEYFSIYKDYRA